jgi:transposase-like protein
MQSATRARPHKTLAQRADILAAYRQTALSSHRFARQHGIAASTLFRWLRQASTATPSGAARLIEVPNLLGQQRPAPAYCLRFANGLSVELAPGFQPDEVRTLAQLIRGL